MPDSRCQQLDDRIIGTDIGQIFLRAFLVFLNQRAKIIVDYSLHLILVDWAKHSVKHVTHLIKTIYTVYTVFYSSQPIVVNV